MSEIESHAAEEPREVELKLDCAGPDLTALAAHPRLQGAAASEPELLATTYYDTPGRELRAAGLTLRVRAQGGRHIQTVKAGSGDVGLFDRAEWESEIAGETPESDAWAGTAAEAVLREAGAAAGAPVLHDRDASGDPAWRRAPRASWSRWTRAASRARRATLRSAASSWSFRRATPPTCSRSRSRSPRPSRCASASTPRAPSASR